MPADKEYVGDEPLFFRVDPLARQFPLAWRDILFRRRAKTALTGKPAYDCPICKKGFDHTDIDFLEGDHIWPYSLFGDTSWANYQLICGECNSRKRNFVDDAVRQSLGDGTFRKAVCDYLRDAVVAGKIDNVELVTLLLSQNEFEREDGVAKWRS